MPSVLILGATSDIGYAIAKKFAAEKYDIQLAARNPELLGPMQSDIQLRYSVNCTLHAFDATDFDKHREFYKGLTPSPDITVFVIGYMTDNEVAFNSWTESLT